MIEIELDQILDLINCADDYGFNKSPLMCSFAEIIKTLTDEDIEKFAKGFLTEEMRKQGYSEEDYEESKERLNNFRTVYMKA